MKTITRTNKKLVSQFVRAYINVDPNKLNELLHDDGNYLGLSKDGGIYVLNSFSTIDNTELTYCRMTVEKCNSDSQFTLSVEIQYMDKRHFTEAKKPTFISKPRIDGGEFLRYFLFNFKDGKIFEATNKVW